MVIVLEEDTNDPIYIAKILLLAVRDYHYMMLLDEDSDLKSFLMAAAIEGSSDVKEIILQILKESDDDNLCEILEAAHTLLPDNSTPIDSYEYLALLEGLS